jgi:hypothetical protein
LSVAQVILRWVIQRGIIALAKSTRKERMVENISVFDFELGTEDLAAVTTLDAKTASFFDYRDPERVKWALENWIFNRRVLPKCLGTTQYPFSTAWLVLRLQSSYK